MKITTFAMAVVGFAMMTQNGMQSQAYVLKNRVDLTPTAVQNSGATYGPNVVTEIPGNSPRNAMEQRAPADGLDDLMTTTDESTVETSEYIPVTDSSRRMTTVPPKMIRTVAVRDNGTSDTVTTTQSSAFLNDQQAQMEPEHTGSGAWIAAGVGLLALLMIIFFARKRNA